MAKENPNTAHRREHSGGRVGSQGTWLHRCDKLGGHLRGWGQRGVQQEMWPPKSDWERDTWTRTQHRGLSTSCPQPCLQVSIRVHTCDYLAPPTPAKAAVPSAVPSVGRSPEQGGPSTAGPSVHSIHVCLSTTTVCPHSPTPVYTASRPDHAMSAWCPHPPMPVHTQEETLFKGTAAVSLAHGPSVSSPQAGGPGSRAAASLIAGDPSQALQLLCVCVSNGPSHGIPVHPGPGLYLEQQVFPPPMWGASASEAR